MVFVALTVSSVMVRGFAGSGEAEVLMSKVPAQALLPERSSFIDGLNMKVTLFRCAVCFAVVCSQPQIIIFHFHLVSHPAFISGNT